MNETPESEALHTKGLELGVTLDRSVPFRKQMFTGRSLQSFTNTSYNHHIKRSFREKNRDFNAIMQPERNFVRHKESLLEVSATLLFHAC